MDFLEDYKRYKSSVGFVVLEPSIFIVLLYRVRRGIKKLSKYNPLKLIFMLVFEPTYYFLSIFFGIQLPKNCDIGPGLVIHHYGGIVLNSLTIMGDNCTLRQNVTIGNKNSLDDVPIIGNNVNIGAGAVLIGRIKIGDNVDIGANAVVINDVPCNHIAVGVPAKIIAKK